MSSPTREPADRRGPHWQPLTATERAALFAAIDRHLHPRQRPDERAHRHRTCPDCGSPAVWRHFRYGPRGAACCPNCGWEEAPF